MTIGLIALVAAAGIWAWHSGPRHMDSKMLLLGTILPLLSQFFASPHIEGGVLVSVWTIWFLSLARARPSRGRILKYFQLGSILITSVSLLALTNTWSIIWAGYLFWLYKGMSRLKAERELFKKEIIDMRAYASKYRRPSPTQLHSNADKWPKAG